VRACVVPDAGTVNTTTTTITLELAFDGETVSGHAVDADGVRRGFSGWIGLMGVLDALLQGETNAHR
jgi:hypothetical protein